MAPNKLKPEQVAEILKVHNDYRASVGSSNMLKFRWNQDLADLSQGHVDHCTLEHVNMRLPDGTGVGQNSYGHSGSTNVAAGVKAWIGEEKNYDFEKQECKLNWENCGHLTQVISARTQSVGCAIKEDCPGQWKSIMACNYYPSRGSYKKGAACSACPTAKCDGGLCVCGNPFCGKNGSLDLKTCKCACKKPFIGAACNKTSCPPKDKWYCGGYWPKSYCKVWQCAKRLPLHVRNMLSI